jgi:hypothetical protein
VKEYDENHFQFNSSLFQPLPSTDENGCYFGYDSHIDYESESDGDMDVI